MPTTTTAPLEADRKAALAAIAGTLGGGASGQTAARRIVAKLSPVERWVAANGEAAGVLRDHAAKPRVRAKARRVAAE
jgi:hypothetical protein